MINHYAGPEKYCPRYRPQCLAREWSRQGHNVTIVGASYSHLFISSPSFGGSYLCEMENGIRYILLKTPSYSGNGIGRIVNMIVFVAQLWRMRKWLARQLSPDIVLAGSTHTLDFLPALRIARYGRTVIAREVRDLWPLTLTDLGGFPAWHPMVLLFKAAETYSYRNADKITTTLPNSLEYMKDRGLPAEKWMYIPQGVQLDLQDNAELPAGHLEILDGLQRKARLGVNG